MSSMTLASYLKTIRPSSVDVEVGQMRMSMYWVALKNQYHAVIYDGDQKDIINIWTPVWGDFLRGIGDYSPSLLASVYDCIGIENDHFTCYDISQHTQPQHSQPATNE